MLFYISSFSCKEIENEQRFVAPATKNKSKYILSALNRAIHDHITVISPAETRAHKFFSGGTVDVEEEISLKSFPTLGSNNKLVRAFGHFLTRLSFFIYLLINISENDTVVVYHSLSLITPIKMLRRIKKFCFVLEAEEVYSDVLQKKNLRNKEISFMKTADKYIFVSELLNKEINIKNKPYVVCNGSYELVHKSEERVSDGLIHAVYAGTFKQFKGVDRAIESALYLDENYVIEIIGFGTDNDIKNTKELINSVSKKTKCKINYCGFKTGDELTRFIQSCDIGLCTQYADAEFDATSFPSKILMYMSNGLKVVSIKTPAIENSNVSDCIVFFDYRDPSSIADSIKKAVESNIDSRAVLEKLDEFFLEDIKKLLLRECKNE